MSKGQRGNKEAKKPKQPSKVPAPNTPTKPGDATSTPGTTTPRRGTR